MKLKTNKFLYLVLGLPLLVLSCSKGSEARPEEIPVKGEPAKEVTTGVYTVVNINLDTATNGNSTAKTFYYSLETNRIVPEAERQTANWDIAFLGTYNSSLSANNGSAQYSVGYGGPGKGGLYLVQNEAIDAQYYDKANKKIKSIPSRSLFDQAFNTVTTAVSDDQYLTNGFVQLDHFQGSEDGWAWYDFYGELFPDAPGDTKQHVAYALPRPILVRTAKGNYAKVVIYSLYKDAPENPTRSNKPGFINFKFAIQKNGSKDLNIK